eukprot:1488232-Ditylum_brightwellii.AAC.1
MSQIDQLCKAKEYSNKDPGIKKTSKENPQTITHPERSFHGSNNRNKHGNKYVNNVKEDGISDPEEPEDNGKTEH